MCRLVDSLCFQSYTENMIKLKRDFKKVIAGVAAFCGMGVLTSCYGCPMTDESVFPVSGTVMGASEKSVSGISVVSGIKVTLMRDGKEIASTETDDSGDYYMEFFYNELEEAEYQLVFEDIDGEENGTYKTKVQTVNADGKKYIRLDVQLD